MAGFSASWNGPSAQQRGTEAKLDTPTGALAATGGAPQREVRFAGSPAFVKGFRDALVAGGSESGATWIPTDGASPGGAKMPPAKDPEPEEEL